MAQPAERPVAALDLAVFVAELALLAALAVAGYRLGSGVSAVVLAIVLPLVAATLWAKYLAPRAGRPLPARPRLVTKLALVLIAAVLLVVSGAVVWGIVFGVAIGALFAAGELYTPRSD